MIRPRWARGSRGHKGISPQARERLRAIWATSPLDSEYARLMRRADETTAHLISDYQRRQARQNAFFGGPPVPPTLPPLNAPGEGPHVHVRLEAVASRYIEVMDKTRDAVSQSAFETELRAVTTSVDERIDIRKAAIELAKLGVTSSDVARLIGNGHRYEARRAVEARSIVDRMRAAADHTLEQFGARLIQEIEAEG